MAIVLLMVAAVELTVHFTNKWRETQSATELLAFQPEREQEFEAYIDSLREAEYAARKAEYDKQYADNHPKQALCLQPFDPNTADSAMLVSVGLKPWMAKNLIRYRKAGKVFRKPEDMHNLYGMSDSLYSILEPYIQIDSVFLAENKESKADSVSVQYRVKKDTILNINTADTTELQFLRGVGHYSAVQIVRYRQALGGFYALDQLYEIKELSAQRVDSIVPHLFVDASLITPIVVNSATVKQLQRHPYISYRQAEQLYDLRRRKVHVHSIDELSDIFTGEELLRLEPYLNFSK